MGEQASGLSGESWRKKRGSSGCLYPLQTIVGGEERGRERERGKLSGIMRPTTNQYHVHQMIMAKNHPRQKRKNKLQYSDS